MKSIFLLTTLLFCVSMFGYGQATTYGNFKIADQEIIYQKVFPQDSITLDKLGDYFVKLPFVQDLDMSNDQLNFQINDFVVDYKKFQFSQVSTPSIIQTGKYSGVVHVAAKDGKYRVTIKSFQLTGDIVYQKILKKESLTKFACRDNGTYISQDWCKPNTLGLLDKALTDKMQYVGKPVEGGDDW